MADRLMLKSVNGQLARLGHRARPEKASGYFYFFGGEAAERTSRTVQVGKISDLTLDRWVAEFASETDQRGFMRQGGAGMRARKPVRSETRERRLGVCARRYRGPGAFPEVGAPRRPGLGPQGCMHLHQSRLDQINAEKPANSFDSWALTL